MMGLKGCEQRVPRFTSFAKTAEERSSVHGTSLRTHKNTALRRGA